MESNEKAPKTIDEYLEGFPTEIQEILKKIRKIVQKAAPDATEAISYGMPTFVLNGNLVHFAAFKNHIGFYPTPKGIEQFQKELSVYKGAKGSIRFPLEEAMPYELIAEIVKFRVKENLEKAAKKKSK